MDRKIIYPGQVPLETDLLNVNKMAYLALAKLVGAVLGPGPLVNGLACTPTSPASMSVLIGAGEIYAQEVTDQNAYSSLGTDSTSIVKQGILASPVQLTFIAPVTNGYSINYLIEVAFEEQDINPIVLSYYNAANPQQAYSGPGGSGTAQNTMRQDTVAIQVKDGTPAPTGSQTTPAADSGYIALYVVTVAYGQSTITAASISAVSGAPFIGGTLTQKASGTMPIRGFVNLLVNGTLDIWPTGTGPMTVTQDGAYTAEGWIVTPTGASCTVQQAQGRTNGLTLNSLQLTGASGVTDIQCAQLIESYAAQQMAGQTVTVQAQIFNGTGGPITPTLTTWMARLQDNWGYSPFTDLNTTSLQSCPNNAWTQIAYTFTASSYAGTGYGLVFDFGNNFSNSGRYVRIGEVEIRVTPGVTTGLNSSPPVPEMRPIDVELARCQRYFQSSYDFGVAPGTITSAGAPSHVVENTFFYAAIPITIPVKMRIGPTITLYSPGTGASGKIYNNNTATDIASGIYFTGESGFLPFVNNVSVSTGQSVSVHYTASARL